MSNWLITLTYQREIKSGGNGAQYISAVTVKYQYSKNCFAKFAGEYPTEIEINRLIEKYTEEEESFNFIQQKYNVKMKTTPTITFMQKLEEVEE